MASFISKLSCFQSNSSLLKSYKFTGVQDPPGFYSQRFRDFLQLEQQYLDLSSSYLKYLTSFSRLLTYYLCQSLDFCAWNLFFSFCSLIFSSFESCRLASLSSFFCFQTCSSVLSFLICLFLGALLFLDICDQVASSRLLRSSSYFINLFLYSLLLKLQEYEFKNHHVSKIFKSFIKFLQ